MHTTYFSNTLIHFDNNAVKNCLCILKLENAKNKKNGQTFKKFQDGFA